MLKPEYVVSSNIDAIGYQLGKLYIRFKSGVSYMYENVGFGMYDAMLKAESCGQFFHRFIRGKAHYTRLDFDPFN